MNFAKFVRTPFSQNTMGRLLLAISVSMVMKGKLANETVNYDTKLKHMYQCTNLTKKCKLSKKGSPTNTPLGFHVETTRKRSFPRGFNVESTWCVGREP